jgi:hypothetical protein
MPDLEIESLRLTFRNATGHEHRIASIAERAMALLAERMEERRSMPPIADLRPAPARLDLAATGDEQAARVVADLCLEALALRL